MAIHEIHVRGKGANEVSVYRFEGITAGEARILAREVLTDPVTQLSALNPKRPKFFHEIGFRPGVTDPMELSLKKAASLFHIFPTAVSTSHRFKTRKRPSQIEEIIVAKPKTLLTRGKPTKTQTILLRNLSDEKLLKLSNNRSLFLNLEEMKVLQNYYRKIHRDPTDVELETFAQTWSEHCYHKTFKAKIIINGKEKLPLIDRIKNESRKYFKEKHVVSAFSDNAGGMKFYYGFSIVGKGETHNSPVAIEPYAGALTKNGGLYRDIAGFGQGGKNLVSFMMNNFASPGTEPAEVLAGSIHPKTLFVENSRGEREYGNPMGIPTQSISLHEHPNFGPKPTSLGVAIGIIPNRFVKKEKPRPGDLVVSIGGKTGRDGIHGATFSSGSMDERTKTAQSTAVQLGDPIVEKAMFDAILALRDKGLIRAITDCGAGGYASAVGEMADGVGASVDLRKIPQKYQGLSPWELWLSESQERMVLAVSHEYWKDVERVARSFETEATVIGKFTGDNRLTINDGLRVVADIDLSFLHHGLPKRLMVATYEKKTKKPVGKTWKSVLSHLSVCSKESMQRMYDQTVQGMTVLSSFVGKYQDVPSDATVLAPFPDKRYGVVAACAINPVSEWSFSVAAAKFTACGGDIKKAVGIDNFITAFPDPETLGDVDRMTDGLVDMIAVTHVPIVSGKDSLSSTYKSPGGKVINVPPSIAITLFGKIPDIRKTISPDFKRTGSTICLLKTFQGAHKAIVSGNVLSAKAIAEGGLAATISLMCFGGDCGAKIKSGIDLFVERPGSLVLEVESPLFAKKLFAGLPLVIIGKTQKQKNINGVSLDELKRIWQKPLEEIYG